ncbi:MAG: TrkH family potassium uptake protein [Gammaproteobacteria bacterium]|nr:TrkH family potassium uptake protein [Gammaproteobacteria bacterium]MDH5736025.1 TrkH family potassium uptake protein [Gammaproteobacteria bacterium]
MLFSITSLPPLLIDLWYQEGTGYAFLDSYATLLITGLVMWLPVRNEKQDLRLRDGFLVVVLFWFVLGVSGALPFILYEPLDISVADAVFESISGLTTTGATVLTGLENLPHSILFYRHELQWLGGMGIIVLAVAILPMLGIGGMQLYRAEAPGPVKDNKLTPRITETAKALWYIYLSLTIACALSYWFAGMGAFDAIAHSFSTVAIGGFSTHDASIGFYDSVWVEATAMVFMLLGGVNFALHFMVFRRWNFKIYSSDAEFVTYIRVLFLVAIICVSYLYYNHTYGDLASALRQGVFHAISIGTTTGFTMSEFYLWPGFLPVLLLFSSFIGGCAGSTGGGMKVIRVLLLLKQGMRELMRLVHPSAQVVVKIGNKPVSDSVMDAVWGFFAAYVGVFVIMMLLLMASGIDQVTSFSAVAATMNNLGPGLGDVGANYAGINDFAKWVLCVCMLMGRLEIFTLLVLFTPAFWRK